jgi:transcriptional regulator with XRE-family HTH domain
METESKSMARTFGDLLREQRLRAEKSLQDVAKHLDVSIAYVSDVERGRRGAFKTDRIHRIAEFLKVDPEPLLAAAHDALSPDARADPGVDNFYTIFESFLEHFRALDAREQKEIAAFLSSGAAPEPAQLSLAMNLVKLKKKQRTSAYRLEGPNAINGQTQPRRRRNARALSDP